jgi:MFS transporter, NNP family, nitrate/nitrite transporter
LKDEGFEMKISAVGDEARPRTAVLVLSTVGFTLLFAVWLQLGVLGIPIRAELALTDSQFAWLTAIAILSGSIGRLPFGIWTDRYGGRGVFTGLLLLASPACFLLARAQSYEALLWAGFLVGLAGNSFSVGIAWNSAWFPSHRQGFALGTFGAGNVGASLTKLIGPLLIALVPAAGLFGMTPGGWRFVPFLYGLLLLIMALVLWTCAPALDKKPGAGRSLRQLLAPLRHVRVWRFSSYYVIVFGAYVALSVWLPKYYVDVYNLPLKHAALLTALFIFPASLLRPLGGWFADEFGARTIMYWVFGTMCLALLVLSIPPVTILFGATAQAPSGSSQRALRFALGPGWFTFFVFIVGCGMGIGKAAVYKYIPDYFPRDVGAVGGVVGLLGALGGFFMPPLFAASSRATGLPQMTFATLLVLTAFSFLWLHVTVTKLMRRASPELSQLFELADAAGAAYRVEPAGASTFSTAQPASHSPRGTVVP